MRDFTLGIYVASFTSVLLWEIEFKYQSVYNKFHTLGSIAYIYCIYYAVNYIYLKNSLLIVLHKNYITLCFFCLILCLLMIISLQFYEKSNQWKIRKWFSLFVKKILFYNYYFHVIYKLFVFYLGKNWNSKWQSS